MRIQLEFSDSGASADIFLDFFKQQWTDMDVKKNKGHSRWHLDMDIEWKWKENRKETLDKSYYVKRIDETLQNTPLVTHVYDLKVGEAGKCYTCDGTGISYYPRDFFQK